MTAEAKDIRVDSTAESPILQSVEVEIAAKRVKKAFDRAYRDLARRVPVKGFRPGKAPRSVLERLYGASIGEQIEQTLVAETLGEAVELAGVEPVSEPAIEADVPKPDEAFRYKARVEVKPPVELPDLAGLPAKKPVAEVGDEEVLTEPSVASTEKPSRAGVAKVSISSSARASSSRASRSSSPAPPPATTSKCASTFPTTTTPASWPGRKPSSRRTSRA